MFDKIKSDIVISMKEKDKEKLSVLRMLKGSIQLEEINKKRSLDDEEVIQIISKQIKQRKDSINEFNKASRDDLVKQNEEEIKILQKYMPKQLSEEEINKILDDNINKLEIISIKDMGKLMKELMPILKGKADMGLVNNLIKEKLK